MLIYSNLICLVTLLTFFYWPSIPYIHRQGGNGTRKSAYWGGARRQSSIGQNVQCQYCVGPPMEAFQGLTKCILLPLAEHSWTWAVFQLTISAFSHLSIVPSRNYYNKTNHIMISIKNVLIPAFSVYQQL